MIEFFQNLLQLSLEAAPWLVLGLVIGGLIKSLIPTSLLQRHLSGQGLSSIVKAALFGAPLPLCSCGVIPAALGLRRAGASKPATISFLVSTPETGIDSVSISYALLGPFMAVVRPVAAIVSAIAAGLLVGRTDEHQQHLLKQNYQKEPQETKQAESDCCRSKVEEPVGSQADCCSKSALISADKLEVAQAVNEGESLNNSLDKEGVVRSCCNNKNDKVIKPDVNHSDSCCGSKSGADGNDSNSQTRSFIGEAWDGIVYSFTDLFDKVLFWLLIGMVFAALVKTFVPVTFLAEWGSGLPAMLLMLVVGIPMYVCATASTPIAAGLLLAGVSPGTAMVFLMAGPATNISTLGVIGKELGKRSLIAYLVGVGVTALVTGFVVDYLVKTLHINVQSQISHSHEMVPAVLAWASLILLIGVVAKMKFKR